MYFLTPTRKSFEDPNNGRNFYLFFHIFKYNNIFHLNGLNLITLNIDFYY